MTRLWAGGDPVRVDVTPEGVPARFCRRGIWYTVDAVANRWRVTATWWRPGANVARDYFKLTTTDGLLCTLYVDLQTGGWFCARLYD